MRTYLIKGFICGPSRRSQPPLVLSVPLSRFTPRVGGGSFFVRRLAFMKFSEIIFILSVLLSGCGQKHTIKHTMRADHSAMDLVLTDRFTTFQGGYILYVEKRSGTNLQNITVFKTEPDGDTRTAKMTIHAEAGTLSPDFDKRTLKLSLRDARCVTVNMTVPKITTSKEMVILLRE